jgi:hypothetical protein
MSEAVKVTHIRRNRRSLRLVILLMTAGLAMLAAAVCVVLGEKGLGVSESLWRVAVDVCRVVTGLLGLLVIQSVAAGRRSQASRRDTFWTVVSGVVFLVAAVAGLRLVIVITGFGGLVLLYAGGAVAVEAFRSGLVWPEARCDRHGPLDPVGDPGGVVVEIEPDVAVLVVDPREPLVDDLDDRDVAVGR